MTFFISHSSKCFNFLALFTVWQWRKPRDEFGGTDKFFVDQDDVFFGKNSIFAAKISDDLFLVIDQLFRIFPLFYLIYRIFRPTLLDIVHNPFLTRKTPLFTLFLLSRTSDNTTSQNIGGRMHRPSPTSNFGGPPSPPRFPPLPCGLIFFFTANIFDDFFESFTVNFTFR